MVTLGPKTPCTDALFCDSHHREGRADLTPLLNAEQKGGLKISVQTVVNLEKQETSSPAKQWWRPALSLWIVTRLLVTNIWRKVLSSPHPGKQAVWCCQTLKWHQWLQLFVWIVENVSLPVVLKSTRLELNVALWSTSCEHCFIQCYTSSYQEDGLPNFSFGYELVKCKAGLVLITQ